MEKNPEKITFNYTDEFGQETTLTYETEMDYDNSHMFLARAMNLFMKAITYQMEKDYVFLESVDEEEYEELALYLQSIRNEEADADFEDASY